MIFAIFPSHNGQTKAVGVESKQNVWSKTIL